MLERTKQTAQLIDAPKAHWKALNEIDAVSSHLSHVVRKPVFGVSDQVRHKPCCAATKDG